MRDIDFIRYLIDLIDAKKEAECEPEVAEIVQPAPPAVQPVIVNVKVNGQGGGSATAGVDPDEVDSPISWLLGALRFSSLTFVYFLPCFVVHIQHPVYVAATLILGLACLGS